MRRILYMSLLKILSITAIATYLYAPVVIFRTALFGDDGGFVSIAVYAAAVIAGLIARRLTARFIPRFSVLISWCLIILPAAASFLAHRQLGELRALYEVIPALVGYIAAIKSAEKSAFQIADRHTLFTGFIVLAACLFITYYAKPLAYLKAWMFAASYLYILAYLVIENQRNIDRNIFDKRYVEKSVLPANLRRFNLLSVLFIFLVFVLLYNFKAIVGYILEIFGVLVVLIIKGIGFIIQKLFSMEPTKVPGDIPGQGGLPGNDEPLAMNPVIEFLLTAVAYIVVIYAVVRIILFMAREVPKLIRRLAKWLGSFFALKEGEYKAETFDYVDISEITKPEPETKERRRANESRKRKRKGGDLTDPSEKVRLMYAHFLKLLIASGIELKKSDTADDILRKTEEALNVSGSLCEFTRIYNQVRYGGITPDITMLSVAQGCFNDIANELGSKGKALPHKPYKTIEKGASKKL